MKVMVVLLQMRLQGQGDLLDMTAPGDQSRAKILSNKQANEERGTHAL